MKSILAVLLLVLAATSLNAKALVSGELKQWHKITITFDGPQTSEDGDPNPFRHHRLDVVFTHAGSGRSMIIPGFYAGDGGAAESSATTGNKWQVRFRPDATGEWRYKAVFRSGEDVSIADSQSGTVTNPDGETGTFRVQASDKKGNDLRRKGMLQYVGAHHLRFAGSGEWFLKGGADSPENFLAFGDFDATRDNDAGSGSYSHIGAFLHKYEPHVKDWRAGDPTWKSGKGKGIIGALNFLASEGVNSVYFLTYNLDGGDGRDTWMWTSPDVRDRYDVSKLDQWEIVFDHMDRLGIMLHVVTQETENDNRLGGGFGLNPIRKLYFRELVARFAHHPAVVWNLGEEDDTPDADRREMAAYIRGLDAFKHPITVHTHANRELQTYVGLYGDPNFEATSVQSAMPRYYPSTLELRRKSAEAGRKWAIFGDEQNPASHGVLPDAADPDHDGPRVQALWGNLMAGGSGVEWYFGHQYPHMDINLEDFRSRDRMWDQTRYALEFFRAHVPFWEAEPLSGVVTGAADARVLARRDSVYLVHLPSGGEPVLEVGAGKYTVRWFNPRSGGTLRSGAVTSVQGPGKRSLGTPPDDPGKDWVVLVKR